MNRVILIVLLIASAVLARDNVIIIVIDGARYTETFGDPSRSYIPEMTEIASEGTYIDHFYNDSITYTSRAIPALWCGTWTDVRDTVNDSGNNTKYAVSPTIFEYFRKATVSGDVNCIYTIKYITSLWLPSYNNNFGPDYWPYFNSQGSKDVDVLDETIGLMREYHPQLLWVYLADVDSYGHSGNWNNYTRAITIADSIVGVIWEEAQQDSVYSGKTTLFVTNDHGRHDDDHGGFTGHGDGCDGCRRILLLAAGPGIKQGYVSTQNRRIPDLAVTALSIFGIEAEYATGEVMDEIFSTVEVGQTAMVHPRNMILHSCYPNPFNSKLTISFSISEPSEIEFRIRDLTGKEIISFNEHYSEPGHHQFNWNANDWNDRTVSSGIYFITTGSAGVFTTSKVVYLK